MVKFKKNVVVTVYLNEKCFESKKQIFARSLFLKDNEECSFSILSVALRALFGTSAIIEFRESYLDE
jgi:hypothetical protein